MRRDPEQGVILINVLVILALSSTIVFAMLRLSETGVTRSQRFGDAVQGLALIAGGEATAIAALRRDMREAPEADHPGEAWAGVAQEEVAIEGGSFSLAIADAQGRFNLNNLARAAPEDLQILQRIIGVLELPETVGLRILARLADPVPLMALDELTGVGISGEEVERLSALVTVLPGPTAINVNTMPEGMFAVLAGNPVQGRLLQGIRARNGQLTQADLLAAGLILNAQAGVKSAYFTVTTRVRIGETVQSRESLLFRMAEPGGGQVFVAARRSVP
ncbi:MAG: general secretion pathway protein GspK [Paracoccaceae bacterium]